MKIGILKQSDLNSTIQNQVSDLFLQLNADIKQNELATILWDNNQITIAYCQEDDTIIGIALMCTYRVISGHKGWIEDVVVDSKFRGKGIGRKLMEALLDVGKEKNLPEILLFTADHRTAAIKLYNSLGFKLKNSRLYIWKAE